MRLGIVTILLISASLFAQAPDTLWTRTFGGIGGDVANGILQTADGGYVIVGQTQSFGAGSWDGWLVRLDENGDSLWSRTYGGGSSDGFLDIEQTSDGGFILVGWTFSFGANNGNAFIIKTNSNGDSLWSGTLGGNQYNDFRSIVVLDDGSIVVVGVDEDPAPEEGNFLFAKYNPSGTLLWSHSPGGPGRQYAWSIGETQDGGYVLAGWSRVGPVNSGADFIVIKTNSVGDSLWSKTWGNGSSVTETLHHIQELADGSFNVIGYANGTPSSGAGRDLYVARLDATGNVVWSRTTELGGTEAFYGGIVTSQNGVLGVGDAGVFDPESDLYDGVVLRYDSMGDSLWALQLGGLNRESFESAWETIDAGYILAGHTTSFGSGDFDFYVVKLDTDPFHRGIFLTSPNGGDSLLYLTQDTIRWNSVGITGNVSIELNRSYPGGAWELIAPSTPNDGEHAWFVSAPLSDSCRIRVCAVEDTFCDVSDSNFSIVASGGFLALVRADQPNTPIQTWNAGIVECPQTRSQWFKFKNTGQNDLIFLAPNEPSSAAFSGTTNCAGPPFGDVLNPGEVSACSALVTFDPTADGTYSDFFLVPSNAQNSLGNLVIFTLLGEQVSTPAAPEVVITSQGEDAILYWSAVDTSVGGCAVSGLRYLVFYSPTSGGPFYYHGGTTDTTYTHVWAVTYAPAMFYQVVAVKAPALLLSELEAGMEMGEVMEIVDGVKRETE